MLKMKFPEDTVLVATLQRLAVFYAGRVDDVEEHHAARCWITLMRANGLSDDELRRYIERTELDLREASSVSATASVSDKRPSEHAATPVFG